MSGFRRTTDQNSCSMLRVQCKNLADTDTVYSNYGNHEGGATNCGDIGTQTLMITLRALKLRKFQSPQWGIEWQKMSLQNWTRILNLHHKKRILTPSALHPFLKLDRNFRSFFSVRKRMFESKLLKRFEVQLNMLFRSGTTQTSLLDGINLCPS